MSTKVMENIFGGLLDVIGTLGTKLKENLADFMDPSKWFGSAIGALGSSVLGMFGNNWFTQNILPHLIKIPTSEEEFDEFVKKWDIPTEKIEAFKGFFFKAAEATKPLVNKAEEAIQDAEKKLKEEVVEAAKNEGIDPASLQKKEEPSTKVTGGEDVPIEETPTNANIPANPNPADKDKDKNKGNGK